jgi:hypothetical protein
MHDLQDFDRGARKKTDRKRFQILLASIFTAMQLLCFLS